MFLSRYFAPVFFAPRYFAELGGVYTGPGVPGRTSVKITGQSLAAKRETTQ